MQTIKSVADLPDWFRLTDYDVCDSFTPQDWGNQLFARIDQYFCTKAGQTALDNPEIFHIDEVIAEITQGCVRNVAQDNGLAAEQAALFFPEDDPRWREYYRPVRPALLESVSEGVASLPSLADFGYPGFMAYDEAKTRSNYAVDHATIEVDLDVPDSVLVEHFKEVVTKYREILNKKRPGKKVSEASVQRLRQYKVLAYLDLTHWAALSGTHIHAEVLARALFPNSERGERFISETVKPWAKSALQPSFFRTLLASYESPPA